MANEFSVSAPSGLTLYVTLHDTSDPTKLWNGSAFETAQTAHWTTYRINMSETGTTGIYTADFPTLITTAGNYSYDVRLLSGIADPADAIYAEGEVEWDGSAVATISTYVTTRAFVKLANQWTDTSNDAAIDQMLPAVTLAIAKFIRRNPVAADITEVRSGSGTDWLRVYNPPINSITSITFAKDEVGEVTITGSNFKFDDQTGTIKFKPQSSPEYAFAEGFRNIEVVYNGGWSEVPDDIEQAAALVIRKLVELGDSERLVTEKVEGNRKVKYDGLAALDLGDPIFAEAKGLLLPYVMVRCF